MKKTFLAFLFIGTLLSCEEQGVLEVTPDENEFLILNDDQAFSDYLNEALAASVEDLKIIEESRGFISFGRKADELYQEAVTDHFGSREELLDFVERNSKFLQIVTEENGELSFESRLSESPFRYLANLDGIYRHKGIATKLFEQGTAQVPFDKLALLYGLTEEDFAAGRLEKDGVMFNPVENLHSLKDAANNCGFSSVTGLMANSSNTRRVRLSISISDALVNDQDSKEDFFKIGVSSTAWAQNKVFGIWFDTRFTISSVFNIVMDYQIDGVWQRSFYNAPRQSTSGRRYLYSNVAEDVEDFHFGGYYAWADIAATSAAVLSCNKSLTCAQSGADCISPSGNTGGGGPADPCLGVTCPRGTTCVGGNCVFE